MTKGITSTGFEFEFNDKALKDARLIEKVAALSNEDLRSLTYVLDKLLGEEQKEKLYDHVAELDPDGMADIQKVISEIGEMVKAAGDEEKK